MSYDDIQDDHHDHESGPYHEGYPDMSVEEYEQWLATVEATLPPQTNNPSYRGYTIDANGNDCDIPF